LAITTSPKLTANWLRRGDADTVQKRTLFSLQSIYDSIDLLNGTDTHWRGRWAQVSR
jgi:hypothetical protein